MKLFTESFAADDFLSVALALALAITLVSVQPVDDGMKKEFKMDFVVVAAAAQVGVVTYVVDE